MELFSAFPHESGIVMQRGIEIGMVLSSSLLAHSLYVLHGHERSSSIHPYMDLFFECSLLLRVICAIPRPYIWLASWRKFVDARTQPTPELVSQALVGIYTNQNRLEKMLLHFYYAWLFLTTVLALFTPYRTDFGRAVWHHLLLNFACIVLHRMVCIAMFYYLVNSDMSRGIHPTVLEAESHVVKFADLKQRTPSSGPTSTECSICYGDYCSIDDLRVLRCGHEYHKGCIDVWLTKHRNRCPMCMDVIGSNSRYS